MKKILISNNCLAACVYRDCLDIPQPTPFVWNVIQQDDFVKLIANIDTIDFLNFKVIFDTLCQEYYVLIDNLVKVYYVHYKYDQEAEEKYTKLVPERGYMVYCKNIIEYISDEYIKRVNRLIEARETDGVEFVFYYDAGCFQSWTEPLESYLVRKRDELLDLVKIKTPHTICVGHWEWAFLDDVKPMNDKVLYFLKPCDSNGYILQMTEEARYVYEHYLKDLLA